MKNPHQSMSKFLSLVLRHKPEIIDLQLDEGGWASVKELISKMQSNDRPLTLQQLSEIVESNDKQRFILSDDRSRIRANQGHSVQIDLQLEEMIPPHILFHGTAVRNIDSIKQRGLIKGKRHHVHLSENMKTAIQVGARYGKPVVLTVNAYRMYLDGFGFYKSKNNVWLTEFVLPTYIDWSEVNKIKSVT